MNYSGMTVNERLVVSGLIKDFDRAKKEKDKTKIIAILRQIQLDELSITKILKDLGIL